MAQILSIYGLVASVIISGNLSEKMALHTGFLQLGAGLSVGLCGLAAGFAIGIVGDAGGASYSSFLSSAMQPLTLSFSPSKQPTASPLCRHGSHLDLCRGPRSVRCHRVYPDVDSLNHGRDPVSLLDRGRRESIQCNPIMLYSPWGDLRKEEHASHLSLHLTRVMSLVVGVFMSRASLILQLTSRNVSCIMNRS
jgi:F0F1-type ATP synthase membrane subunit c/vacuolar-type H+-ATPase subunit K